MRGDRQYTVDAPKADGAGLGDVSLAARLHLLGSPDGAWFMSAELGVHAPTARLASPNQSYAGDYAGSYEVRLLNEYRSGRLSARALLGSRMRRTETLGARQVGTELTAGLGMLFALGDDISLHAELQGSSFAPHLFTQPQSPLEALFGLKFHGARWTFGVAAGPGFSHAFGSPDLRFVLSLNRADGASFTRRPGGIILVSNPNPQPRPVLAAGTVATGVAVAPAAVNAPVVETSVSPAPLRPQPSVVTPATVGDSTAPVLAAPRTVVAQPGPSQVPQPAKPPQAPPPAKPAPAALTTPAAAPAKPSAARPATPLPTAAPTKPPLVAASGKPPVKPPPSSPKAPQPAPKTTPPKPVKKETTKPVDPATLDSDKDGLFDLKDTCPKEPEDYDDFKDDDGCPDPIATAVRVTCQRIELGDRLFFDSESAVLQSRSLPLLSEVASTLRRTPQLRLVRVEAHTDTTGSEQANLLLSQRRAESVVAFLVKHGVLSTRLLALGLGERAPIAENETIYGRERNRRVDFLVQLGGCGSQLDIKGFP
jgi:outer membrane protein OmpA-like peptidoglycan-associated protein